MILWEQKIYCIQKVFTLYTKNDNFKLSRDNEINLMIHRKEMFFNKIEHEWLWVWSLPGFLEQIGIYLSSLLILTKA